MSDLCDVGRGIEMIKKYEYRKAIPEDIEELVKTRLIVLRAANKLAEDVDMPVVEQGALSISLEVTDMGRPLYEKYGFITMKDEMELV